MSEGIASRASLPLIVLLATGGTAGRARAVPASFGVPGALPPATWGHSFRRAGPIDAARKTAGENEASIGDWPSLLSILRYVGYTLRLSYCHVDI